MWLDLVALGLLGAFVALGAWRGALATGLGLVTLVGAYAAGVALAPVLAPALGAHLELSLFWATPVAGTIAFFASYAALGLVSIVVRRLAQRDSSAPSLRDRFLGGCFGAVRGLLIATLVAYLATWLDVLRSQGVAPGLPEIGDSTAAVVSGELVESGIEAALGEADPAARVAARVAARPSVALAELQRVIENPNVAGLRDDPMFWTYVEHGNVDTALNRGSFQRVAADESLREQLAALGLVPAESARDDRAFHQAVADVLQQVGPRIRGLKNDPQVQQLLADPEVVAMLRSGDTFALLRHPGFRELVDRVASGSTANPVVAPGTEVAP